MKITVVGAVLVVAVVIVAVLVIRVLTERRDPSPQNKDQQIPPL